MLVVIENFLTKHDVKQLRAELDSADWVDGRTTAGSLSAQVKQNRQLDEQHPTALTLGQQLLRALGQHPEFISACLPHKIYPPKFNRYSGGEHYGVHVDAAVMNIAGTNISLRADISATLFLSEPDEYSGGELVIEGEFGAQEIKLNAGDIVLYPASSLHQVMPVTQGSRCSSFFWIQSMVQDTAQRAQLYDLDQAIQALSQNATNNPDTILRLTGVYHNLLRRWAQV